MRSGGGNHASVEAHAADWLARPYAFTESANTASTGMMHGWCTRLGIMTCTTAIAMQGFQRCQEGKRGITRHHTTKPQLHPQPHLALDLADLTERHNLESLGVVTASMAKTHP